MRRNQLEIEPASAKAMNPHASNERQSRARFKIDRDTVLRINRSPSRRHRSLCDTEWPPKEEERPHVNTNTQRFDARKITRNQVAGIRGFFDNYETTMDEWRARDRNMTLAGSSASAENLRTLNGHATQSPIPRIIVDAVDDENQSQFQQILSTSTPNLSLLPSSPTCRLLSLFKPLRSDFHMPSAVQNEPCALEGARQRFNELHDKSCSEGESNIHDASQHDVNGSKEDVNVVETPIISQCNISDVRIASVANEATSCESDVKCDKSLDWTDALRKMEQHLSHLHRNHSHTWSAPIKNDTSDCLSFVKTTLDNDKNSKAIKTEPQEITLQWSRNDNTHSDDDFQTRAQARQAIEQHHQSTTSDDIARAPSPTTTDKVSANFHNEKVKSISSSTQSINETPTDPMTNSCRFERNLNLDLFFDREMSIWLSDRRHHRLAVGEHNNDEIDGKMADNVAHVPADDEMRVECAAVDSSKSEDDDEFDDVETKLSHVDSFCSTIVESDYVKSDNSSRTNSAIDRKLIDNSSGHRGEYQRSCRCGRGDDASTTPAPNDNAISSRQTFTDGEFIYGPYNFDLFTNHFYQAYDDDDESEMAVASRCRQHRSSCELLKNHDELDNSNKNSVEGRPEVSFVRAVDIDDHKSHSMHAATEMCGETTAQWKGSQQNADAADDDDVEIEISVTNCTHDDGPQHYYHSHDSDRAKHFNYDDDLLRQGDCEWSTNGFSRRKVHTAPAKASINASQLARRRLDVPLMFGLKNLQLRLKMLTPGMSRLVNNSRQFNYERDDVVDENEFSCSNDDAIRQNGQKMKISSSNNQRQQQCRPTTNFNVKHSTDDDVENEIRIDPLRTPNDIIGDNSSVKLTKFRCCCYCECCW